MSDETDTVSSFTFAYWNCSGMVSFCNVEFNGQHLIKRAYGWMHTCVSYDFYNASMSVSVDYQVVHKKMSNEWFTYEWFAFQSIGVSWDSWYYQYTFPEMFTLLNIYTRSRN